MLDCRGRTPCGAAGAAATWCGAPGGATGAGATPGVCAGAEPPTFMHAVWVIHGDADADGLEATDAAAGVRAGAAGAGCMAAKGSRRGGEVWFVVRTFSFVSIEQTIGTRALGPSGCNEQVSMRVCEYECVSVSECETVRL